MLEQLLPRKADNAYRGHVSALWVLGVVLLVKLAMSFNTVFYTYKVAVNADGIPLDTFPQAAVQTVLSLFAIWGLAQFVLCVMGAVFLVRYRALVPLMFLLFTAEHLLRKLLLQFLPIARTGRTPGAGVNLALLVLLLLGLVLSLQWRRRAVLSPA